MAIARFRGRALPEPATLAGYAALIDRYDLRLPLPAQLCAIAERHRPVSTSATGELVGSASTAPNWSSQRPE